MLSTRLRELAVNHTKGRTVPQMRQLRKRQRPRRTQHFYVIIQSNSASCSMHRKDCAEIKATTILLLFQKSENPDYAERNFAYRETVFGAANAPLRAQAASQNCSPAPCRLLG